MEKVIVPEGYRRVMPYLIVSGATVFIDFMVKVFDATVKMKEMHSENVIMHGELQVGDSVIMFADSSAEYPPKTAGMFIYVADTDATFQAALSAGATSIQEPTTRLYGRAAGINDPVGNTWWITTAPKA